MSKSKDKKNKENGIIWKIIALIYITITLIFFVSVARMNLLPMNYLMIFAGVEAVLLASITLGLVLKHKGITINIICTLLAIILCLVYVFATKYVNATYGFLGSIFKEEKEIGEYYIIVKKDSKYNVISDIANESVYLFQMDGSVKEDINSKVNVNYNDAENLHQLGEELIADKIKVALISEGQYDMLDEEIENFKNNTKIISTTTQTIEVAAEENDSNSKYNIDNGTFNIYISGIDTAGSIRKVSRSDANIILTVNAKTHEILLTSIPRDYYVTLHSKKAKDKLTHSGIYGINETISTVEDLLGIDINYYVRVNFTTVIKLVDKLGGVDVYSDYSFNAQGYHFNKGTNHVNGAQALAFSRERHSFSGGDNQRVQNQQKVIEAIIKKVTNSSTILTKYTDILGSLEGSFQSNIDQNEISSLVKSQLNNMAAWTVTNNALTGTGASKSTYSMGSQLLYVMIPNSSSIQESADKINAIMNK